MITEPRKYRERVQVLADVVDPGRILSDEVGGKFLDRLCGGHEMAPVAGLSQAHDALIRVNMYKQVMLRRKSVSHPLSSFKSLLVVYSFAVFLCLSRPADPFRPPIARLYTFFPASSLLLFIKNPCLPAPEASLLSLISPFQVPKNPNIFPLSAVFLQKVSFAFPPK